MFRIAVAPAVLLALLPAIASAAPVESSYTASMTLVSSTCGETLGTEMERQVSIVKDGKKYTITPVEVGLEARYTGYAIRDGFTVALESACPVVPNPACSPNSETITALKRGAGGRSYSVVWLIVARNADNTLSCVNVWTGKAVRDKQ